MNKHAEEQAILSLRLWRLMAGFIVCTGLLMLFGRIAFIDGALIILSGVMIGFFLLRDEILIIQELRRYFLDKTTSKNPIEFSNQRNKYQLHTTGYSPELSDLTWLIFNAEQQISADYKSLLVENNHRYNILYNLPLPVILVDTRHHVQEFNKKAKSLFSHIETDKHIAFIIRNNYLIQQIQMVNEKKKPFTEIEISLDHDSSSCFAVLISRFSAENTHRTAILFFDRTASAQIERMRSEFVANVSHELRTPLTSIVGFVETLQGKAGENKQTREKFLDILHQQSQRLIRLVSDQLSLSKIEHSEKDLPQTPLDLCQLTQSVITSLRGHAKQEKITLKTNIPKRSVMICGDSDELTQMIQNLTENAIRYGRKTGSIDISIQAPIHYRKQTDKQYCIIAIKDDGEGIAPRHLSRLTERFYRVDKDRSRKLGGTGLGLAIVKHIVQHHRGYLEIDSIIGKGSVFCVYLPLYMD